MLNAASMLSWFSVLLLACAVAFWIAHRRLPVVQPIGRTAYPSGALVQLACGLMLLGTVSSALAAILAIFG